MRQAGILAAAGIYALEHNVTRIKEDHGHAKRLAQILHTIPSVSLNPTHVETNIIVFEVKDNGRSPAQLVSELKQEGVLINAIGGRKFRAVTHLDISAEDIEEAGRLFAGVLTR